MSFSFTYDVFLSFRGEDTHSTFICHLRRLLDRKGIRVCGDERDSILRPSSHWISIVLSKCALVVISKNYASSSCCLDDLARIINESKKSLIVFPVFYQIEPRDVIKDPEEFATRLGERDPEILERWWKSLTKLVSIPGEHSNKWEDDSELIQKIADDLWLTLSLSSSGGLVGMDHRVSSIYQFVGMDCHIQAVCGGLMELESDKETRIVGIWGVGGGGKTILARFVLDKIMPDFHTHVFLENVGKIYHEHGSSRLQEELLWETIQKSYNNRSDVSKARLRYRKVLLIVDGVDNNKQLEDVKKVATRFGAGSRIIVITRDKNLLEDNGVKHVYEVKCLKIHEALQLFYQFAFEQQAPSCRFRQLSIRAVQLSGRIPLALEVLASFLHGKGEKEWETVLQKLETQESSMFDVEVSGDEEAEDSFGDNPSDESGEGPSILSET